MPKVNIAIASPSDVAAERDAIPKVFNRWNSRNEHAFLHPVMWESASVPELGDHPQHILDKTIIDKSDLLIAILWSRLGTPTPTATSGTVEEIQEFIAKKGPRRVMLYFCTRAVPYHNIDPTEFQKLQAFKAEMKLRGLYHEYDTVPQFERDLYAHLDTKVKQLLDGELPIPSGQPNVGNVRQDTALLGPRHADSRLNELIDFGSSIETIARGFSARMDQFGDNSAAGPDKFLSLGAHVYRSVAVCLDRALTSSAIGSSPDSRAFVVWVSERLKRLADSQEAYSKKPFPDFWREGRAISKELSAHVEELERRVRQEEQAAATRRAISRPDDSVPF